MLSAPSTSLDRIERAVIRALSKGSLSLEMLANSSGLSIDQARRGIERLRYKDLVSIEEQVGKEIILAEDAKKALKDGLPERRLVGAIIAGSRTANDAVSSGWLRPNEITAAISNARRNGWIELISGGSLLLKDDTYKQQSPEEIALLKLHRGIDPEKLEKEVRPGFERLATRPNYFDIKESKKILLSLTPKGHSLLFDASEPSNLVSKLTPELISTGKWRNIELSRLDTSSPGPTLNPGRSHPLSDMINEIKEIFVGLGFVEISGSLIQSAFWNFDALYIPQDHPAREMQDTFYLTGLRETIPAAKGLIARVAAVHKKGWGSRWNPDQGEKLVLRTHTTPVTLQHLAEARPDSARLFSVGRVFRNEKVSYKHLVEFHQVEGVATHPKASLRDLIGLQTEFYNKLGATKIKFWPTFFPYTEPSLQSMVYNDKIGKWVELFGMGIFRPDVTKPLGISNPVLAWGGGLERIAMLRLSLDDVRELYKSKISWLRTVPKCPL